MREVGTSFAEISRRVEIPASTLASAYQRYQTTGAVLAPTRSGRVQKITPRGTRHLVIASRRNREIPLWQLRQDFAPQASIRTIKRRLAEHGIHKHIKAERPRLTPVLARKRYEWCIRHRDWTIDEWRRVVWSDECSVEKYADPAVQWVFRTSKEKWLPECVKGVRKSGGIKQMVWACFAGGLKGTCNGMRVVDGGRVNARAYVRTLDFSLLDFLKELEEKGIRPIFMQDNARVHTARLTMAWLEENEVDVLEDWPPYLPDLNPIEHVWVHLKKLYHEYYAHLAEDTRSADKVKPLMEEALIHCWELIPDTLFERLVESIPRRIKAVIKAKGWYTKY